jgi:hypothetical protein
MQKIDHISDWISLILFQEFQPIFVHMTSKLTIKARFGT